MRRCLQLRILFIISALVLLSFSTEVFAQQLVPDFTLTDIDGNEFSLSDYRGKVVLLDFFARWCKPCYSVIPHLKSLHEEFSEKLVILTISVDPTYDTVEGLQEFRETYGIKWSIARDIADVSQKYEIEYIPTTIIIDQNGYLQHRHVGGQVKETTLSEEIEGLLAEPSPFDFDVTIPQTVEIAQGDSTSYDIKVGLVSGTPETVALSLNGLPSDIRYTIASSSEKPPYTTTLMITTTKETATGTYILTLTGTSGGKTHTATCTLKVNKSSLPWIYLVGVLMGIAMMSLALVLYWTRKGA